MAALGGGTGSVSARRGAGRGSVVVTMAGELDMSNAPVLSGVVAPLLDNPEVVEIVFDMSALAFMDSSVLAVLVKAAASGKAVRLRRPGPVVREVIEVTGLAGVLRCEP